MDSMDPFDFKPIEQENQDEIIERIREQLEGGDSEAVRRAVLGLGWLDSGEEMLEPLLKLAAGSKPDIAMAALGGVAKIGSAQAERPLARLVLDLFKAGKDTHQEVRAEAIRALGKVGGAESPKFLAEMIKNPAPATLADKEAAVEALVSLADREIEGVVTLLEQLAGDMDGELAQSLEAAIRELNLQEWEDKGFLTIEAELEQNGEQGGEEQK